MPDCPNCHHSIADNSATCPHCGADIEKYRSMLGSRPTALAVRRPVESGGGRSFPVVPVALAIAAIGVVIYFLMPRQFPQMELTPAKSNTSRIDPCMGKSQCVWVYLAPW